MIFGEIQTESSENTILSNSVTINNKQSKVKIKKGTQIDKNHIKLLLQNNINSIVCAQLEKDDIEENLAVHKISQSLINKKNSNLKMSKAHEGRSNIISNVDGILKFDSHQLFCVNSVADEIGVASLKEYSFVKKNQTIASIKSITFAVNIYVLEKIQKKAINCFQVLPFLKLNVHLIQTKTKGTLDKVLNKTFLVTEQRLKKFGINNFVNKTCDHNIKSLSENITNSVNQGADVIFVFGASAISDIKDIIPQSLKANNGKIIRLGMPVEPGNLMLLGKIKTTQKNITFIGMPGCARSPKENGVDWIIWRIFCGLEVSNKDINQMGNGGLL